MRFGCIFKSKERGFYVFEFYPEIYFKHHMISGFSEINPTTLAVVIKNKGFVGIIDRNLR